MAEDPATMAAQAMVLSIEGHLASQRKVLVSLPGYSQAIEVHKVAHTDGLVTLTGKTMTYLLSLQALQAQAVIMVSAEPDQSQPAGFGMRSGSGRG
jgi:hypothetical protein